MLYKFIGSSKGIFNVITLAELVISLLYVLIGLIFFVFPDISNILVSLFIGLMLISYGGMQIYSFVKKETITLFSFNLVFGIVNIIIGLLIIFLGKLLTILLGIYVIIVGIQKVNSAILLKKIKEPSWLLTLVVGLILVCFAIVNFFATGSTIISAAGIVLLGLGIINIVNIIFLRQRSINFLV